MKEVTLPSGKLLQINVAPFLDSKALYQAFLEEVKFLEVKGTDQIDFNLLKQLVCVSLSSKKIELALEKCLVRALYDGRIISSSTWESVDARGDYIQACVEVAKENVLPFLKSLMQGLGPLLETIIGDLASRQKTTQT